MPTFSASPRVHADQHGLAAAGPTRKASARPRRNREELVAVDRDAVREAPVRAVAPHDLAAEKVYRLELRGAARRDHQLACTAQPQGPFTAQRSAPSQFARVEVDRAEVPFTFAEEQEVRQAGGIDNGAARAGA